MQNTEPQLSIEQILAEARLKIESLTGVSVSLRLEFKAMPTPEDVIATVVRATKINAVDLKSNSRKAPVVFARYYAIKLFKKHLKMSLTGIGGQLHRHHTTIIYALNTFEDLYFSSKEFRQGFNECEKAFIEKIAP